MKLNCKNIQSTPVRKRTAKHYSKQRIKKRHVDECAAALSWLEENGLTPVKVTVVNSETQQLENRKRLKMLWVYMEKS